MPTTSTSPRRALRLVRSALLVAGLAAAAQAQDTIPLAKQRLVTINNQQYMLTSKLRSILIGSFFYNFNHTTGAPLLDSTLKRLGREEGWTVDISKSGTEITATKLSTYQVFFANFISSWASNTGFPTASRTAVQNFVENQGGGVFVMHSSGDSRSSSNWAWYYSTLMPITYTGESSRTDVTARVGINPAAKTHPIMEGIGFGANGSGSGTADTVIFTQGEWHTFNARIATVKPTADFLFKMNPATCIKGGTTANCGASAGTYATPAEGYPASWTFPAGKGTVGYFMEAHDLTTRNNMGQANWDRFFKQFMYWMAGYDTVPVVSIGRANAGIQSIDRSGISFHSKVPGVFITAKGGHTVSLYDLSGKRLKHYVGRQGPVNYSNLTDGLKGASKRGVYIVKVSAGKKVATRRYIY